MKLPYSWIKELAGVDWSPKEMARRLTASGTAGEANVPEPEDFAHIVIGHTVKVAKHPNADKLTVAEVEVGNGEVKTIVCGASNCEADQKVVVALPGAVLQGKFEIKPIKMRGVESSGMICAEDELGLSDDHSGIMVLDKDAPAGMAVYDYLELGDPVIDFEITPNRPDCLCALGLAREVAVLAEKDFIYELSRPEEAKEKASDYISVKINDPDACPRYAARIIKNIKKGTSPLWMQKRLQACGMRPINNIVDITNYVMLETNQPLHAFDYDLFGSSEVVVRRASKDEKFTTLDGQDHILDESVLMITNGQVGVATGGVMGGLNSEVIEGTKTILLESAYFNPSVIRKSARKLGLSTESSYRFERGIDANNVIVAVDRAAALMAEFAGGEVLNGVVDAYPERIESKEISLRPERVNYLLGTELPPEYMVAVLKRLGLDIKSDNPIKVVVPTFRPDLEREVDLIEEIARINGLENIPIARDNKGPLISPIHKRDTIRNNIRNIMVGLGFDETLGSGFAHPERMKKIDPDLEPIKIINPLSDEFAFLRARLLYSLLQSAGHNIRHRNMDLRIFETGRIYLRDVDDTGMEYLGILISGQTSDSNWKSPPEAADFFDLKGVLEALCDGLNLENPYPEPIAAPGYDRMQAYKIKCGDIEIGTAGMVDKKVAREFEIKQEVLAAELKLSALIEAQKGLTPYKNLPKFPASTRDIAVIVDNKTAAGDLLDAIYDTGGDLVETVRVFDLFTGEPVPEGQKSLAFAVIYRSPDKTLSDEAVDSIQGKIVEKLSRQFSARLRE